MLQNITTLDAIEKEALEIQSYLEITCSDDGNEITSRGFELSVYLARSGKLLADAKYHQDIARKVATTTFHGQGYSPSILKDLINSETKYQNYMVNWLDRVNRTCTHQIDWCRSALSMLKEEMKNFK